MGVTYLLVMSDTENWGSTLNLHHVMEECCYLLRKVVSERADDIDNRATVVDTCLTRLYLPREWKEYSASPEA